MARTDPQVNLRMPDELKIQLEKAAQANNRSVTAEVVDRLQRSFGEVEPDFRETEWRFAAAMLDARLSSLRLEWRLAATQINLLEDRLKRATSDTERRALQAEIDKAKAEKDSLELQGRAAREEVIKLAAERP